MEILLVILCSIILGAVNLGFFFLGQRINLKDEEGVKVDKDNAEKINEFVEWINYNGKGNR